MTVIQTSVFKIQNYCRLKSPVMIPTSIRALHRHPCNFRPIHVSSAVELVGLICSPRFRPLVETNSLKLTQISKIREMEEGNQLIGLRTPVADASGEIVQTRFLGNLAACLSPDFIMLMKEEKTRFRLFHNNSVELHNIYNNLRKVFAFIHFVFVPHIPI